MTILHRLPRALRPWAQASALVTVLVLGAGCSSSDDDPTITGPEFPEGPGRVYAVSNITFDTIDGVPVSAAFGRVPGAGPHPTAILVHEVGNSQARQEWLASGLFEALLARGYNVLALDLRGHGGTPLPADGRAQQLLFLEDLESMHLEVRAAVSWLRSEATADAGRLAVIGNGIGANIAYVAMGAFPDDLQAGVALSPGFWDRDFEPLVIGNGISPFDPHTMLYLVGGSDAVAVSDTESLSYASFATTLAALTRSSDLRIFDGSTSHGLALLQTEANLELIIAWLDEHL